MTHRERSNFRTDVNSVESIRSYIKELYSAGTPVRLSIKMSHPKLIVEDAPAFIKGVYPNFFRVEECAAGFTRCHSVQYTDVLIGRVSICGSDQPGFKSTGN